MFNYNVKHIISSKPKIGLALSRFNIPIFYPLFILFHITLSCNRKCKWCYQDKDDFYLSHRNTNLDVGIFRDVLASFKILRPHIHIYGGEPLLHEHFPLFLEYSKKYGYNPTITTNGDYLDKYSDDIIGGSMSQLNISIDGLIDTHGNIDIEQDDKIRKFISLNKGKKSINLNYVIKLDGNEHVEDLVLHFNNKYKEGDISCFCVQHFMLNEALDSKRKDEFSNLSRLIIRLKKMDLRFKLLFLPDIKTSHMEKYYCTKDVFRNECYVPWLGLSVYPDLTVTSGAGVLGCNFILGNLAESSILDIWNGPRIRSFRSQLRTNGLPDSCNRCCHKVYY